MKRTHNCGGLRASHIGQTVHLAGWVQTVRDHGGVLFVDLRDRSGIAQIVFRGGKATAQASGRSSVPEALRSGTAQAGQLGLEYVISIEGLVQARPQGTKNPDMATGDIEVEISRLEILNAAQPPPFPVASKGIEASEEIRLKYRYLDLRRQNMTRAMKARHDFLQAVRTFFDREGFWEIETPILAKSTPEGARDFLVPCRQAPGSFYALPQSPQIFKQMLMVSGMEKYYQIARCFRDEDLRADRQPEFTQIDVEMSFAGQQDVIGLMERMLAESLEKAFGVRPGIPFKRLSYEQIMERYQSDKPDLRWPGYERRRLDDIFRGTGFKVFAEALAGGKPIYSLTVPQALAAASRSRLDESVALVMSLGAKGLVWLKLSDGAMESPAAKFFSDAEKQALAASAAKGDVLFICAEEAPLAEKALTALQKRWIEITSQPPAADYVFCWVFGFPLLEYKPEEKRWDATHNPFTAPVQEDMALLDTDPAKIRSQQYDLIMNGVELGGGSIRNHQRSVQEKLFSLMGYSKEIYLDRFGWMLEALDYGAPPHGGIAFGVDRIIAMMLGADSIREVIAFPKTQKGTCLFSGAPTPVEAKQLKELGIKADQKGAQGAG